MDKITSQNLFIHLPQRKIIIDWDNNSPFLKRFILSHLLETVVEYRVPSMVFTKESLVTILSKRMGGIALSQVEMYVETLIIHEYILESPKNGVRLSRKVMNDIEKLDKIIISRGCKK